MAARLGTFDELLAIAQEPLRPIMCRLRDTILAVHPEACETVRLGDRAATFGLGPRKMIEGYAYVMPQSAWVNLGFFRGTSLGDPLGLLEGSGAKMRHVKIRSMADADRPEVRELLAAAVAERVRVLHADARRGELRPRGVDQASESTIEMRACRQQGSGRA